jgi:hypothetical protein
MFRDVRHCISRIVFASFVSDRSLVGIVFDRERDLSEF